MKHPADVVLALAATNSRLSKEEILSKAWDLKITEFFSGAQLAMDALATFGVKKIPLIDSDEAGPAPGSWGNREFLALADKLIKRQLTGHAARDALLEAANACNTHEWNNWYRRLFLKDFKAGLSESTINKVLGTKGTAGKKYIVPVFACQLAKNGEDHPNKIKGRKLIDIKLDGVRLLTVFNKEVGTVTQYSRDGRLNENFEHITQALATLLPQLNESLVLDGEIVSASFQALMRQLKRKNADTKDANLALFDIVPLKDFLKGEYKVAQSDRHLALCELEPLLKKATNDSVWVVPKMEIDLDTAEGLKKLAEFNRETIEAGLEGIMIKDPDAVYRCKRTDAWLKKKPFLTVDLTIVGVESGTVGSKFEHTMGNLVLEGEDQGRKIQVEVGSGFSEELRDEIWANRKKIIGRIAEIKGDAFTQAQNSTCWSMRFPVFMQFRGWEPGEKI